MDELATRYNKHYITVDGQGRITEGWSDGPFPDKDATGAVCINEEGGYQFRLVPGGEENPVLLDRQGIPLYKWENGQVVERTQEELAADRAALPTPGPSAAEKLEAQVTYTAMMTDTLIEEV